MNRVSIKDTKAVLLAHIAAQDAQILSMAREAETQRLRAAQTKLPVAQYQAPVGTHKAYYEYVGAQRRAQSGNKVCTYKTFAQWNASLTKREYDDANYVRNYDDDTHVAREVAVQA